jgi:hypothetical protein
MRTLAVIVAATVTLPITGCIPMERDDRSEVQRALPRADDVAIKVPEGAAASAYAVGDLADYYQITRRVSRDLNAGAAWVLVLVHTVVQFPATTIDGNVYTWGPHSNALDPAEWRLTVTENADGTYDWAFDGRSKLEADAEFLTVISGHAVPGLEPHRGSGSFLIDFDASEQVNPLENDGRGTAEIAYDLENRDGTQATLSIQIDTVEEIDGGERPVTLQYAYGENADGSGDLQFQLHGDLDDDGSQVEDALIRSRWLTDGAGRADVMASGGDLGSETVTASECWDSTFRRTYYSDSNEWLPTEGDPNDCAFADQDLPSSL